MPNRPGNDVGCKRIPLDLGKLTQPPDVETLDFESIDSTQARARSNGGRRGKPGMPGAPLCTLYLNNPTTVPPVVFQDFSHWLCESECCDVQPARAAR